MKGVFDRETDIELHLEGWNCIPHCCSHRASLSKSFCSVSRSEEYLIGQYRIQSSANILVCDDANAGRSLINVKKRRGPRTDLHTLCPICSDFSFPALFAKT